MIISFSFAQLLAAAAMVCVAVGVVVVVGMLRIRAQRVGGWRDGQTRRSDEEGEG